MGLVLLFYVGFIIATCYIAQQKGLAVWPMGVLSAVIPVVGLVVVLVMKPVEGSVWAMKNDAGLARQSVRVVHEHSPTAQGPAPIAEELARLAALRDSGVITEEEFAARKRKLIDS